MKRFFAAAVAVLVTSACGVDKGEPFRNGFPRSDTVKLKVPGTATALTSTGTRQDGLEGDTAAFYAITRGVTVVVNGATVAVLTLVEKIVENPPTTVTGNVAVWGPHTDPLSPNTWRFTVTKNAADNYSYLLEGKAKTAADTAYVVVLSGTHTSTGSKLGHGSFLLDWEKAKTLPEHDANVGTAECTYSRDSATDPVTVDVNFTNVLDKDTQKLINAAYKFRSTPGQGGSFEFQFAKDLVTTSSALETMTIKSRWLETGAGRSDVQATGGDLASAATVNECWDSNFASRFLKVSYDSKANYGQESVCAFATAEYAAP